jgi:hypothetical protein
VQLQKYKTIISVYFTPNYQLWGILDNGKKKCLLKNAVVGTELDNFLKDKKIISYGDTKVVNKGYFSNKGGVGFRGKNVEAIPKSITPTNDPKGIKVFNMGGLKFLKEKVLNNSVDLVLTDPPYIISKNSGFEKLLKKKKEFNKQNG